MSRPPLKSNRSAGQSGLDAVRSGSDDSAFQLQKQLLGTAEVIFDIGGHTGQTSEKYRTLFPDTRIHFFEPQPKALAQARKKLGEDAISYHALALSDQPGEASFRIHAFTAASSLQPIHEKATDYWPAPALQLREEIKVPVSTVDQVCADIQLDQIDILKIDVQGSEFAVLQGASDLLSRQAARLVYFEYIHCETYEGPKGSRGLFRSDVRLWISFGIHLQSGSGRSRP